MRLLIFRTACNIWWFKCKDQNAFAVTARFPWLCTISQHQVEQHFIGRRLDSMMQRPRALLLSYRLQSRCPTRFEV